MVLSEIQFPKSDAWLSCSSAVLRYACTLFSEKPISLILVGQYVYIYIYDMICIYSIYTCMHLWIHMDTLSSLPYLRYMCANTVYTHICVSPYVGCPILHDHVPTVPLVFEGIQGFSGTTRPATGSWAWRRGRDTPVPAQELTAEVKPPEVKPAKGEEKVYIPSIDDILARLDQEDEEEQAMR